MDSGLLNNISNSLCEPIKYPAVSGVDFDAKFEERWTRAYDFMRGKSESLPIREACNQLIHSKIYSPFVVDSLGVMGIYFSSDRKYKSCAYYLQLFKVAEMFLSASEDRKVELEMHIKGTQFSFIRLPKPQSTPEPSPRP